MSTKEQRDEWQRLAAIAHGDGCVCTECHGIYGFAREAVPALLQDVAESEKVNIDTRERALCAAASLVRWRLEKQCRCVGGGACVACICLNEALKAIAEVRK